MADNTQKMSYQAGETKGQAQEKASNLMDRADNAAQSAKESVQEVHIFLFNLMFYMFLENSFSPQWHNGLCIRFKNDKKPKRKGKKE
ncbi:hypothetical protein NC651_010941 [Populus alba x Populus x berolinensis]|nr:hypothetical protein NC651_010941 [Populus alba x Populus x berolinensis]